MKRSIILFLLIAIFTACNSDYSDNITKILLTDGWQFRKYENGEKLYPAQVPGCIHTDLLTNKLIEDPYYGANEKKLQWISEETWEYVLEFDIDRNILKKNVVNMVFEGLDTYADVYLNGELLLAADNMFRSWEIDCKEKLLQGKNNLTIIFQPPLKVVENVWEELGYKLPGGKQVFTRKAPFHYGWDWGPVFTTSGIWKPLYIEAYDIAKISDFHIALDTLKDEKAEMYAEIEIESANNEDINIVLLQGDSIISTIEKEIEEGTTKFSFSFNIENPKLWWPSGYGEQNLYNFTLQLQKNNSTLDSATCRTGIRTVELVQVQERSGKSFMFRINNQPIFMKGANYIPQDNFQNRVTEERYKELLQDVVAANMNMLRVWGGGIYENDIFYDLCDEYGILVWQDFMFACAMYPSDTIFLKNVEQEAIDNVQRMRKHPSVALWCGNNEINEAWHNWGWQTGRTTAEIDTIWNGYNRLFNNVLPTVVTNLSPQTPYWESSPQLGRGNPNSISQGDSHYWGVWHDAEPFEVLAQKVPRFMSEFGFQAYPEMATIETFTTPADRTINSEVIKNHQKHQRGNQLILEYMEREYFLPDTFATLLYLSQVLQAEGMKIGFEAQRRSMPWCMGTLYWQLNDCWPVVSWSGRDYYGRWKALHYFAQRAFSKVLISPVSTEEGVQIYIVSDSIHSFSGKLKLKLMEFSGNIVWEETANVEVAANASHVYKRIDLKNYLQGARKNLLVLVATLEKEEQVISSNHLYFNIPKELKLENPGISIKTEKSEKGYKISLSTVSLARNVYLSINENGFFTDNYFDLMPGQVKILTFETLEDISSFQTKLKITSLFDTFPND